MVLPALRLNLAASGLAPGPALKKDADRGLFLADVVLWEFGFDHPLLSFFFYCFIFVLDSAWMYGLARTWWAFVVDPFLTRETEDLRSSGAFLSTGLYFLLYFVIARFCTWLASMVVHTRLHILYP